MSGTGDTVRVHGVLDGRGGRQVQFPVAQLPVQFGGVPVDERNPARHIPGREPVEDRDEVGVRDATDAQRSGVRGHPQKSTTLPRELRPAALTSGSKIPIMGKPAEGGPMDYKSIKRFVPENAAKVIPPGNPACPVNGHDVYRAWRPTGPSSWRAISGSPRHPRDHAGGEGAGRRGCVRTGQVGRGFEGRLHRDDPGDLRPHDRRGGEKGGVRHPVRHPRRPHHGEEHFETEVEGARALIAAELAAGYTSFRHRRVVQRDPDNARITASLAGPSWSTSSASRWRWGRSSRWDRGAPVDRREPSISWSG